MAMKAPPWGNPVPGGTPAFSPDSRLVVEQAQCSQEGASRIAGVPVGADLSVQQLQLCAPRLSAWLEGILLDSCSTLG